MVNRNNFFFEEELFNTRKPLGTYIIKDKSLNIKLPNLTQDVTAINRTKELFPLPKNEPENSSSYIKLVIKVGAVKEAPTNQKSQFQQLIYFSRIEKKEESEELKIKNSDTFLYDHNDNIINTTEEINEIAKQWTKHKHRKGDEAISRHLTLSIGGKEDKDKILVATSQFLKETLGVKGYEYCYAPHYDTKNDHIHLIVKKRNKLGKNFRLSKSDLQKFKTRYNEYLAIIGIKRDISRRLEDDAVIIKIREQQEGLTNDNSWHQNQLNKGNEKDFNAYHYKATLSGKIEEQINIIQVKESLKQLGVKDDNLINVIKPYLRKNGIKSVQSSLLAVKQMQEKDNDIQNLNGFIIKAVKDEYKAGYKNSKIAAENNFQINPEIEKVSKGLKDVKKNIISKNTKQDIVKALNQSIDHLKTINEPVANPKSNLV